jgi:hypothetical protein
MKLTRAQLKQIIKEVLSTTDPKEMNRWISQNTLAINDLYGEVRRVRGELEGSIEELTAKLYDSLSTGEKPSRFAGAPVVSAPPGRSSGPEEPTMSEMKLTKSQLKDLIKEELGTLSEGGLAGHFDPSERLPLGYKMPPENKATEAMRLLSQIYSNTTEEWSPKARESFDVLLELLKEMEEDLNINP